MHKFITILV